VTSPNTHLTRQVFVAGGIPTITYNPRDARHLESEVQSYLDQSGKALSISGPTKSGKTVLVERLLPLDTSIWMHGSDLVSTDTFWDKIVDWLNLYDAVEHGEQGQTQGGSEFGGTIGVPHVASVTGKVSEGSTATQSVKYSRKRAPADVAREALAVVSTPIIVDDFHYVDESVKRDISRAIKSILPLTHVVLMAVPHEAFEAIRAEPDMGGRVWNLSVEPWSEEELLDIAVKGFAALHLRDRDNAVGRKLAQESYGAPFLMQQLCYDLAVSNGVLQTLAIQQMVQAPPDWEDFFRRIANRTEPAVFEKLLKGPNPRGQERIKRELQDGRKTDIYGAVLYALKLLGPKPRIRYQEIVRVLDTELIEPARGQQVTSSLGHMASIAKEARGSGDAALDYKNDELFILDPFLLFYLRYGSWELSDTLAS
jgi:hypothetical protein